MTTKKAQHQSTIDGPKASGRFTLYPVTFGLLEWLQTTRKNPLLVGGKPTIRNAVELCYAFTKPAAEVCRIPSAKLNSLVTDFQNQLTPEEFRRIQKHAETELLKFSETAVVPKKKPTPPKLSRKK